MSAFRKGFNSVVVARRVFPAISPLSFSGSAAISPHQPRNQYEITLSRKKVANHKPAHVRVPWFPMSREELDGLGTHSLEYGAELESEHPGFLDTEYRNRRRAIVEKGRNYKYDSNEPLPAVEYSATENATWAYIYDHLKGASQKHAIKAFNEILHDMERECDYDKGRVPQLESVSQFLSSRTGFALRPVSGLLSARDFLNALALKVFFSTQYIRHPSRPLHTPEPDVVHELIGHAPMLADPDFAALSHEIGLASLGASDEEIEKLATSYWFSVEFGLCKEDGRTKAYGAGVLSSVDEIEHACAPPTAAPPRHSLSLPSSLPGPSAPQYQPWDPSLASVQVFACTPPIQQQTGKYRHSTHVANLNGGLLLNITMQCLVLTSRVSSAQPYPITALQPLYFVAESLADAKSKMRDYARKMEKPFAASFDADKGRVVTSPVVGRTPRPDTERA